ncbi:hypothetical protein E2542_SST07423 [Spatholobus suberectus]|nr:hypothetical protein E2542_SST07423 [Spatholobus suberectus]
MVNLMWVFAVQSIVSTGGLSDHGLESIFFLQGMVSIGGLGGHELGDVRSVADGDDDGESHDRDDDGEGEVTNQNVSQGAAFCCGCDFMDLCGVTREKKKKEFFEREVMVGEAVEFQPDFGVEDANNDVIGIVGVGPEAKGVDQAEEARVQVVWGWWI